LRAGVDGRDQGEADLAGLGPTSAAYQISIANGVMRCAEGVMPDERSAGDGGWCRYAYHHIDRLCKKSTFSTGVGNTTPQSRLLLADTQGKPPHISIFWWLIPIDAKKNEFSRSLAPC
jgi:hypothetical protein